MKRITIFLALLLACATHLNAQDFKGRQQAQEKIITAAYKKHKVTDKEYEKLMNEQETIKAAIDRGAMEGWTPHDKNNVEGKLGRAARRLKRYETNREKY